MHWRDGTLLWVSLLTYFLPKDQEVRKETSSIQELVLLVGWLVLDIRYIGRCGSWHHMTSLGVAVVRINSRWAWWLGFYVQHIVGTSKTRSFVRRCFGIFGTCKDCVIVLLVLFDVGLLFRWPSFILVKLELNLKEKMVQGQVSIEDSLLHLLTLLKAAMWLVYFTSLLRYTIVYWGILLRCTIVYIIVHWDLLL